ncbi:MAG: restriction endonuclease subunit S [Bacteroidales bacterium]|nr:restriction endonuclease subunit S [Bacteroidales bacterium]
MSESNNNITSIQPVVNSDQLIEHSVESLMVNNNNNKNLYVPTKREQCQTCLSNAERAELRSKSNVPNLRFPEFKGEWKEYSIGEICETITDFVAAGSFASLRENIVYSDVPLYAQLVRIVDVKNEFSNPDFVYVDKKAFDLLWRVTLDKEAVLLPNIGINIGEAYYVTPKTFPYDKNVLGPNAILLRSKNNSTSFFFYRVNTNAFAKALVKIVGASRQLKFNKTELKTIQLFYPALAEQNRIAKLLFLLDERIATQNKIIEKLQSLIKGLNHLLLNPGKDWTIYELNDLAKIKCGYSGSQVSGPTPYKVSRIETISKHCIDMLRIGYVQEINESYKLNIGDILFSNINSVQYIGNTAYIDKDYGLYHGMNLLRIIPNIDVIKPYFLHLLLCTDKAINHFQTICNKAVSQASINQTALGKSQFSIPSISVQQEICCIFELIERKIKNELQYIDNLKRQKEYLLRQLFI